MTVSGKSIQECPNAESDLRGGRESTPHRSTAPVRVAHLISHPIQYYAPLYRLLAVSPRFELTVCFCSGAEDTGFVGEEFNISSHWDIPLTAGYRYKFLRDINDSCTAGDRSSITASAVSYLRRERPDVVWIGGYSTITAAVTSLWARLTGVGVLLMDDATLLDDRPKVRQFLKGIIFPLVFGNVRALYAGSQNRRFFRRYGIPEDKLFFAPHSVDNAFFRMQASALSRRKRDLRLSFGLPDDVPVVLFCGKLVPRKDLLTLVRAFGRVRRGHECALLIAGDGPLRRSLEDYVLAEGIEDVRFSGFLNQTEIGTAYAVADMLVLPSREGETWGLVVNEAMNFSLPVIVSDRVGCALDLVIPAVNGYIFAAGDAEALAHDIRRLVTDRGRREAFGIRSLRMIENWDVARTAAGVLEACFALVSRD